MAEGIVSNFYQISGLKSGIYYFKVIAYNPFGSTSSNCIEIQVELPQTGILVPVFNLILLLILFFIISDIFLTLKIKKRIKKKSDPIS